MSLLEEREHLGVLKKDRTISRGDFLGNTLPGGQNENGLLFSQESRSPVGKPRAQNEIILLGPEDIECRNLC